MGGNCEGQDYCLGNKQETNTDFHVSIKQRVSPNECVWVMELHHRNNIKRFIVDFLFSQIRIIFDKSI